MPKHNKLNLEIAKLLFLPLTFSLLASQAQAVTHEVGEGKNYPSLRELNDLGVLTDGDIISLYQNDNSFIGETLSLTDITIMSADGSMITLTQSTNTPPPVFGGLISFSANNVNLNIENIQIMNSSVQGTVADTGHGIGGAVRAEGNLTINNANNINFINNTARGGENGSNSGLGGAIYTHNTLNLSSANNMLFTGNKAISGDSTSTVPSTGSIMFAAQGGAIYASNLNLTNASNITFSDNQAIGGNGINVVYSGHGGAIYVSAGIDMTNASNILFSNNIAKGGTASTNGKADVSGLGGAIFIMGGLSTPSVISGATFLNNQATTDNDGDMTSGLGGAIYNGGTDLTLLATAGNNITFTGNTHNPGNTGVKANSIYFGNTTPSAVTTTFTADVEDGAYLIMLDPMASQQDNMLGKAGTRVGNVDLTINKTGDGTWILGGHSEMASATTWNINQGTLYLTAINNAPVHIDLSHDTTAAFNVASGSNILLSLTDTAHLISGLDIAFNAGSNVGVEQGGSFRYFELAHGSENPLLSLRAQNSLNNDSAILNPSGSFTSGVYDYTYDLYWRENDPTSEDLIARITSKTYNQELGGSSATTAPTAIASLNAMGRSLFEQLHWSFKCLDDCTDNTNCNTSCSQSNDKTSNLWLKPTYAHSSQNNGSDFTINAPGFAMGLDNCFDNNYFAGVGIFANSPNYRSRDANIDAQNINIAGYAGTLLPGKIELGVMAGGGHTWYDQKRKAAGISHKSKYQSTNLNVATSLAKNFKLNDTWALAPFTSYEYLHLNVQGYKEKLATHSLKAKSHKENLHLTRTGSDLTWTDQKDLTISGKVYHAGLYGNNRAKTKVNFVADANATKYRSRGDKLTKNALGMGVSSAYNLNKNLQLAANYNLEKGKRSRVHHGSLNLVYNF